ncbi:uncharacterized protein LOC127391811 isoform X2 [Apus apus]|uniref:uncharacterized protein LOC127391811 isoform X2 n=1 Tax=Apus apus TaxID=8895 RepID=UPI0021F8F93D|nr:uncharacterized protein LOC127391811 isoform X2 [Apus apus]
MQHVELTSAILFLQVNDWQNDWVTFFAKQRIQPQMDMIEKNSGDREARELWAQLQTDTPGRKPLVSPGQLCCSRHDSTMDLFGLPQLLDLILVPRDMWTVNFGALCRLLPGTVNFGALRHLLPARRKGKKESSISKGSGSQFAPARPTRVSTGTLQEATLATTALRTKRGSLDQESICHLLSDLQGQLSALQGRVSSLKGQVSSRQGLESDWQGQNEKDQELLTSIQVRAVKLERIIEALTLVTRSLMDKLQQTDEDLKAS